MKPPARKRTKPHAAVKTEPEPYSNVLCNWDVLEKKKLLAALKALVKTDGAQEDLDYTALKKDLPTRSTTEIERVIDALKDKVISSVCGKLEQKRRDDNKLRKPIDKWTHMASVVGGALDQPITTAFSQVFMVSSTEPSTLRNCDPPHMDTPLTHQHKALTRIVPFRPMHRIPVQGDRPHISALRLLPKLQPPALTASPTQTPPAPSPGSTNTTPPPTQESQEAAGNPPLTNGTSCQTSASTPGHTHTTPPHQTSPQHRSTTSCPRALGVKSIVDFEKIYQYLSVVHNPGEGYQLTPMESAILLDLLMSLPEELHLLDCKHLRKHLIQVYQSLLIPSDSKLVQELFKDFREGGAEGDPQENLPPNSGPKALQPQQSQSCSSEEEQLGGLCPPLNPFMVPPQLLMRTLKTHPQI